MNGMCLGSELCVGHCGVTITSIWNLTPFSVVDNEVRGTCCLSLHTLKTEAIFSSETLTKGPHANFILRFYSEIFVQTRIKN